MLEVKDNFVFTHWQIRCKVQKVTAESDLTYFVWFYSIVLFHTSAFLCALSCLPQLRGGHAFQRAMEFQEL